jgi:hypothetical protein
LFRPDPGPLVSQGEPERRASREESAPAAVKRPGACWIGLFEGEGKKKRKINKNSGLKKTSNYFKFF